MKKLEDEKLLSNEENKSLIKKILNKDVKIYIDFAMKFCENFLQWTFVNMNTFCIELLWTWTFITNQHKIMKQDNKGPPTNINV